MNTKLATSRMRTGQWADIIKDCKESGLKVDDYCAQHGLSRNATATGSFAFPPPVRPWKPPFRESRTGDSGSGNSHFVYAYCICFNLL